MSEEQIVKKAFIVSLENRGYLNAGDASPDAVNISRQAAPHAGYQCSVLGMRSPTGALSQLAFGASGEASAPRRAEGGWNVSVFVNYVVHPFVPYVKADLVFVAE